MIHELKTWPAYFERVVDGSKTFEVRKDDRGYQSGDELVLREWDPDRCRASHRCFGSCVPNCAGFTGRITRRTVGFIFRQGFGLDCGEHVVMSLMPAAAGSATSPEETP